MVKRIRNLMAGKAEKSTEASRGRTYSGAVRDYSYGYDEEDAAMGNSVDFVPALLGEIKELAATPFGTYGINNKRLLRGVILYGTASTPEGRHKKSFMLDDMTGRMIVETEEETPTIPSTVLVIGTLERRDGINNVKAKYVKPLSSGEMKIVGTWHTLKVIESINMDVKSASRAVELLRRHSFLTLIRRSWLSSNQLLLRHVLFAVDERTLEGKSV